MTIFYPDIASYDAGIDLSGALVAFGKATQGTWYVNPYFAAFKAEAANHGAFFCAYHFLEAGNAAAQAAACYKVVGKTPLMLDFEPATTRPTLADATAFADSFRKLGGICWFVYLPKWYWSSSPVNSASLAPLISRGLLLVSSSYSAYTDASSGAGWQSYGGMTPTVWQYTDALSFNGVLVDFNAYRGTHAGDQSASAIADTLNEFRSIALTGKLPVPPVPKPVPKPTPPPTPPIPITTTKDDVPMLLQPDPDTVPTGRAWPGVFLFVFGVLFHVEPWEKNAKGVTVNNVSSFEKAGASPVQTITWAQYFTLGGK